jgi:hypothetical protein
MRIVLVLLASFSLLSCAHTTSEGGNPALARCPESDKASSCTSGPLKCEVDEKHNCDLCRCERMVF